MQSTFGQQWYYPVGDQDGDGAEDLPRGEDLYSGWDFLHGEPGAAIEAPKPFRTVDHLLGVLQLDHGGVPALIGLTNGRGRRPYSS